MKLVGKLVVSDRLFALEPGRITEIADACATAKIQKPLLVTDRGLASFDITQRTLDLLESAGLGRALFAEVDPNPTEKNLEEGLRVFREGGFDGVIAFGGGSGLDLAKLIAFMVGQTRPAWDFEDIGDWWTRANPDGIKPIIAVPTTAGNRLRGRACGRADEYSHSREEDHLPPKDSTHRRHL
jgi:4-hydroxybutyrate dehydrogenase